MAEASACAGVDAAAVDPPRISVALAVCDGARYLQAQLESLCVQTRPCFEVVAVDDASRDASRAILEEFAARLPLRLFFQPRRLGFARTFERAIKRCKGELIALADQDDVWLPHKLAALAQALAEGGADLAYSDAELIDAAGAPLGARLGEVHRLRPARGRAPRGLILYAPVSGNTLVFRSSLRPCLLPFPRAIAFHDEWIAFAAAARAGIAYVEEPLTLYRRHESSVTATLGRRAPPRSSRAAATRRRHRRALRLERALAAYAGFRALAPEDRAFLAEMRDLAAACRRSCFNWALARFLFRHRRELFALKERPRLLRRIFSLARGRGGLGGARL